MFNATPTGHVVPTHIRISEHISKLQASDTLTVAGVKEEDLLELCQAAAYAPQAPVEPKLTTHVPKASKREGPRLISITTIKGLVILALFLAGAALGVPSASGARANSTPPSNLLRVPYISQDNDHYCFVAAVQMALEYVSKASPSQAELAIEMSEGGCPPESCTKDGMSIPFLIRNYTRVHQMYEGTLDMLKELNSKGYASIIGIHFDTNHVDPHYVVVVGYSETGVIVNDPWPLFWGQPKSRSTGHNAFISNGLLADLWSRFDYWTLIIPYTALSTPESYSVHIYSRGDMQGNAKQQSNVTIVYPNRQPYPDMQPETFKLPAQITVAYGVDFQATANPTVGFTFDRWEASEGVNLTSDPGMSTIHVKAIADGALTAVFKPTFAPSPQPLPYATIPILAAVVAIIAAAIIATRPRRKERTRMW